MVLSLSATRTIEVTVCATGPKYSALVALKANTAVGLECRKTNTAVGLERHKAASAGAPGQAAQKCRRRQAPRRQASVQAPSATRTTERPLAKRPKCRRPTDTQAPGQRQRKQCEPGETPETTPASKPRGASAPADTSRPVSDHSNSGDRGDPGTRPALQAAIRELRAGDTPGLVCPATTRSGAPGVSPRAFGDCFWSSTARG